VEARPPWQPQQRCAPREDHSESRDDQHAPDLEERRAEYATLEERLAVALQGMQIREEAKDERLRDHDAAVERRLRAAEGRLVDADERHAAHDKRLLKAEHRMAEGDGRLCELRQTLKQERKPAPNQRTPRRKILMG